MTEKILQTKKNGMAVLLLVLLGYVVAIAAAAAAGMAGVPGLEGVPGMVGNVVLGVAVVYMALAWILLCGLKVLKPQEALVLTLFGNYIGTLKGEGFYWVNPFCTAVNPAAGTRLSQSGDVQSGDAVGLAAMLGKEAAAQAANRNTDGKKISLKRMTLNNARQKINDCLGNPVEIGIAVIWQVKDTAKATRNTSLCSATAPCAMWCASTPMTWPPASTPPATASPTTAACGAPAKWWPSASGPRSRKRWRKPASRCSKPGSPTWPMRPRSPR